jgi:hypothetical protein
MRPLVKGRRWSGSGSDEDPASQRQTTALGPGERQCIELAHLPRQRGRLLRPCCRHRRGRHDHRPDGGEPAGQDSPGGIDAPETGQEFANRAKQAASNLAFGKAVTIWARNTDRYGRTVAEVIRGRSKHTVDVPLAT